VIALPAPAVAVVALIAFGAGSSGTYYVMNAKRNAELVRMYEAGEKAVKKRQEKVNEYAAEVAALRERKPRVVRYCPDPVPAAGGPDAPGADAPDERDLGPLLREAYEELLRCNKLREAAK